MRALALMSLLLCVEAAAQNAVSVRTASRYIDGRACDPELVQLIFPELGQAGIMDARCGKVRTERQIYTPVATVGEPRVRVTLGGETFHECGLSTLQRNHYPHGIFTGWGYSCADEN